MRLIRDLSSKGEYICRCLYCCSTRCFAQSRRTRCDNCVRGLYCLCIVMQNWVLVAYDPCSIAACCRVGCAVCNIDPCLYRRRWRRYNKPSALSENIGSAMSFVASPFGRTHCSRGYVDLVLHLARPNSSLNDCILIPHLPHLPDIPSI